MNLSIPPIKSFTVILTKLKLPDVQTVFVNLYSLCFVIIFELTFKDLSAEVDEHAVSLFYLTFDTAEIQAVLILFQGYSGLLRDHFVGKLG